MAATISPAVRPAKIITKNATIPVQNSKLVKKNKNSAITNNIFKAIIFFLFDLNFSSFIIPTLQHCSIFKAKKKQAVLQGSAKRLVFGFCYTLLVTQNSILR